MPSGGGLALAAACDLRICTPNARFGVPIAKTVGNCLSMANYARLVAALGAVAHEGAAVHRGLHAGRGGARDSGSSWPSSSPMRSTCRSRHCAQRLATHAPITLQVTQRGHSPNRESVCRRRRRSGAPSLRQQRLPRGRRGLRGKARTAVGRSLTSELEGALRAGARGRDPVRHATRVTSTRPTRACTRSSR